MHFDVILRNLSAGLIVGIVAVIYAFSYAAVIFAGDLSYALPYGIAITLTTAVVVTAITSVFGTIPFGISGPDIYSTLPLAALAAAANLDLAVVEGPATILAAITSATIITGVGLMLLGTLRSTVVVRYVPYPVLAGFLAATGWLVVAAAVRMLSGVPLRTVLGEIGFYTGDPRSASLVAESRTRIYRLSREGYERLVREHPEAMQALATFVIRVLAGRLQIANDLIAAYER